MTRAVIYVPDGEFEQHASRCLEYCRRRGYQFHGLIRGDWQHARQMMIDGETSVVLVSTAEHLDPDRKPRIEVVAEEETMPGQRRTRILRRNAGA